MSAALLIDVILWASVAALGFMAWQRGRPVLVTSLREGTMDFIHIVPRIALGVIGSGYIAAIIPAEFIIGALGPTSGWLGVATAVLAGAATPGGPVIGFSIGAVALKAGGGSPQVLAYVVAWELPILGPDFTLWRIVISLPIPVLAGALGRFVYVRMYPKGEPE